MLIPAVSYDILNSVAGVVLAISRIAYDIAN